MKFFLHYSYKANIKTILKKKKLCTVVKELKIRIYKLIMLQLDVFRRNFSINFYSQHIVHNILKMMGTHFSNKYLKYLYMYNSDDDNLI